MLHEAHKEVQQKKYHAFQSLWKLVEFTHQQMHFY